MSQTLSPAPSQPARISQLLPSVKCSSCNQPVPLSELGDHVCKPAAPVTPPKPTPAPARSMAERLHSLVAPPRPQSPQVSPPSRTGTPVSATRTQSPAPPPPPAHPPPPPPAQQSRPQHGPSSSVSSVSSAFPRRGERGPSPLSRPAVTVEPREIPPPPGPTRRPSHPPILAPPVRVHTPSAPARVGTPSTPTRSTPPSPLRSETPTDPRLRTLSSPRIEEHSSEHPRPPSRARTPSDSGRPTEGLQQRPMMPPADLRSRSPGIPFPSMSSTGPSPPNQFSTSPGQSQGHLSTSPSYISTSPVHLSTSAGSHMSYMSHMSHMSTMSTSTYDPRGSYMPHSPDLEIDTKSGGEAGMAGVGRRGFAAAARAAMLAASLSHHHHQQQPGASSSPGSDWPNMIPTPGMDGRRPNAPRFLDINTARNGTQGNTPPLSPNSHGSHSPHSPFSPVSLHPNSSSPVSPSNPAIATSRTPSPFERDRLTSTPTPADYIPAKTPTTPITPMTPKLPFFEKYKNKLPGNLNTGSSVIGGGDQREKEKDVPLTPLSPDSGSEYSGLAYANETDDEDATLRSPTVESSTRPLRISKTQPMTVDTQGTNMVRFPSVSDKSGSVKLGYSKSTSSTSSGPASPPIANPPTRSISDASAYSSRTMSKVPGGLDRALETLFEDSVSPTSPVSPYSAASSPPAPGLTKSKTTQHRGSTAQTPKLPTRSHTSPTLRHEEVVKKKKARKEKVCVKCEKKIEDGRWINTDGGGVLCEKCWKNMYLPKCRRCTLPIEKHAVSSSDGQLKGKYHRECFNCHTCHKPFPDKTFYVFDGKPFCAYHYHEANESLCAAATCGQPIEGPCAVSHAGDRYHPEHLLCEYPRGCKERLEDYYELDGRMLCERHAFKEDEDGDEDDRDRRATKRTTRFIDLAALGGSGLR